MSCSHSNEVFMPFRFGKVELNDAGDVVSMELVDSAENYYGEDNWRKVADAIVRSPALKEIKLIHYYHDNSGIWNADALAPVFGRERTHPCALEKFDANKSVLGPEILALMLPFFKSTPGIKTIDLDKNELGDEGIRLLSEVLDHTRAENLYLFSNQISGQGLGRLFLAENSKHLHELDLEGNDIGAYGQEAICQFLQRDDTEMRKLHFEYVDQDQFQNVLESISPRSKLVELFNQDEHREDLDEESATTMSQMLKNVICNTDTLEGLCESNHQLVWVGPLIFNMLNSEPILKKAIMINKQLAHGASIVSRIRSKLRAFYFQGQFDVQPFIDMDVVLMPFVLELVTRTERVFCTDDNDGSGRFSDLTGGEHVTLMEGDLGSVYYLVRNCHLPELFAFPSSKSRIQNYERRILSLEDEIARLTVENEELRSQFGRPLKRRGNK